MTTRGRVLVRLMVTHSPQGFGFDARRLHMAIARPRSGDINDKKEMIKHGRR